MDIVLDQAPSIRGHIKGDGNRFFRAVAQEISGHQEDHAELRVLVTTYMAHNPAQLSCYLTSSEKMGQYLRATKMDQQKVRKLKYMALPICLAQRLLCIVLQAPATNG